MKVLHVINALTAVGGAEKSLSNILSYDDNCSYVISLLDCNDGVVSQLIPDGVEHTCIYINRNNKFKSLYLLIKKIREIDPDVIQSWMYASNVICSIVNLAFMNKFNLFWGIHHSLDDYNSEKKSTKVFIKLSSYFSNFSKKIIFCSKVSEAQHIKIGFREKKCTFIPNGHSMPNVKHKININTNNVTIGMAGRFHNVKNWNLAIDSIIEFSKKNPNYSVRFLGVGGGVSLSNDSFNSIVSSSIPSNLKLDFNDICNDMKSFYQSIDLLLLTSNSEGFPNVLCEAMSYGVPCISTNVGDCDYIIDGCYGTVPKGSKESLVKKIESFYDLSLEERELISKSAKTSIKLKVDINDIIAKYNFVWKS